MIETKIDKIFNTRKELEQYESELREKYILLMVFHKDQEIGKPEIYGIDYILHFGERN